MFPKPFILLYFLVLLPTPQSAEIYDTTEPYSDSQSQQNKKGL